MRPCNFHTVVIGGFVAHRGPFQLKWWLWFLYRPKMILLVIVTPKYVGFGYYLGEMLHKFINQKPKKFEEKQKKTKETKKKQRNQKTNPLEETLGHNISPKTLVFWFLWFFWFSSSFFVFFAALYPMKASESKNQKNSKKTKKNKETKKNKKNKKTNPLEETLGHNISPKSLVFLVSLLFFFGFLQVFFVFFSQPCSR